MAGAVDGLLVNGFVIPGDGEELAANENPSSCGGTSSKLLDNWKVNYKLSYTEAQHINLENVSRWLLKHMLRSSV